MTAVTILPQEPIVGRTLTARVTPSGYPATVRLEWLRCGAEPPPCSTVVGTGPSYVIAPADLGYSIVVRATYNGATLRRSAPTAPVYAIPPELTAVSIVGNAVAGKTLTVASTVKGEPVPALAYEWFSCAGEPPVCAEPIPGATAATYTPRGNDVGRVLSARVTAGNLGGNQVSSARTAPVQQVPIVSGLSIVGPAAVGGTLTANFGLDGFPAPAVTYQWLRCDARCSDIAGATEPSYDVAESDVGSRLALTVTATNSAGQAIRRSFPSAGVPPPPRYLRPFPTVRMKGLLVPGGARMTLLRVSAPRGSKVGVVCKGAGCPLRRRSVGRGRIGELERRFLPAGMRITIRVRKPGAIGKHVRILIRDGRVPSRRDACLVPGDKRPNACPPP